MLAPSGFARQAGSVKLIDWGESTPGTLVGMKTVIELPVHLTVRAV